jgi:arylsulfatase A-like enzyme
MRRSLAGREAERPAGLELGHAWRQHGDAQCLRHRILRHELCLPRLDQALSALLTDLKERGMLDDTLVVAVGEFGRTRVILSQGPFGRRHRPQCFSAIGAGGGNRSAADDGESDKTGSAVVSNPVTPQDLHAAVLHALGVPLQKPFRNTGSSSRRFPREADHGAVRVKKGRATAFCRFGFCSVVVIFRVHCASFPSHVD